MASGNLMNTDFGSKENHEHVQSQRGEGMCRDGMIFGAAGSSEGGCPLGGR